MMLEFYSYEMYFGESWLRLDNGKLKTAEAITRIADAINTEATIMSLIVLSELFQVIHHCCSIAKI